MIGISVSLYRITEKPGRGGVGGAYPAEDTNFHRQVDIKPLPNRIAHDSEWLVHFQLEPQVLASLELDPRHSGGPDNLAEPVDIGLFSAVS